MKSVLLIVNPVSGKMKARNSLLSVVKTLQSSGMYVTVAVTERRGHASSLAAKAKENGHEMVICLGGDGTLNETITGLLSSGNNLPLGYIPAGSTNDFATGMKISLKPSKAALTIANGGIKNLDIGHFNQNKYFTYVAAFGAFTATSYNVSQDIKNIYGRLAYFLGGVKEIGKLRSYHMKIVTDHEEIEDDFIFGAVTNSTSVAGIVKLDDSFVDLSDGKFELALIKVPKSISELNKIIHALTTSKFDNGGIEFYKTSSVKFYSNDDIDWTLDGEFAKGESVVNIENIHNAVTFVL